MGCDSSSDDGDDYLSLYLSRFCGILYKRHSPDSHRKEQTHSDDLSCSRKYARFCFSCGLSFDVHIPQSEASLCLYMSLFSHRVFVTFLFVYIILLNNDIAEARGLGCNCIHQNNVSE